MFAFQQRHSPLRRGVTLNEVGSGAVYLLSDLSSEVAKQISILWFIEAQARSCISLVNRCRASLAWT